MRRLFTLALMLIFCFSILQINSEIGTSEETWVKTLYVDDDGDKNYTTIIGALNDASDGDTIYVYNGVYEGYFLINKSIDLIGENKESTIIDGAIITGYLDLPQLPSLIWVRSDNVSITGFTIKNSIRVTAPPVESIAPPAFKYYEGMGIHIHSNNVKINGNMLQNNQGYGILLNESQNTEISNNDMTQHTQACVYVKNSSNNYIFRNNILNNQRGIMFHINSTNNILYHNNFINNTYFHAYSESNNLFYDTISGEGNYWDDYNGTDKNNDALGDNSYVIDGDKNKDIYPLMSTYTGRLVIEEYYVDEGSVIFMLIVGMVITIIFSIPVAYIWYRKTRPPK